MIVRVAVVSLAVPDEDLAWLVRLWASKRPVPVLELSWSHLEKQAGSVSLPWGRRHRVDTT